MEMRFELPGEKLQIDALAMPDEVYEEHRHSLKTGFYLEQVYAGIHVGHLQTHASTIVQYFEPENPLVQLVFCLKGQVRCRCRQADGCHIHISGRHHNLLFFPALPQQLVWKAEKETEIFEISLSPEFFRTYLPAEHIVFSILETDMKRGAPGMVYKHDLYLTAEMQEIIHDILNCRWQGQARRLCAEAKIVELILLQFDQYRQLKAQDRKSLRKTDVAKMQQAKTFMMQHPASPCSLTELAHQIGTNEFTLKKDFKSLFGTTVFKYWHSLRMAYAKEQLLLGKNVSEAAYLSGYKHATHFTAAFKKHFGLMPKELKV